MVATKKTNAEGTANWPFVAGLHGQQQLLVAYCDTWAAIGIASCAQVPAQSRVHPTSKYETHQPRSLTPDGAGQALDNKRHKDTKENRNDTKQDPTKTTTCRRY